MREVPRIVAETEIGSKVIVEVWREGKIKQLTVVLGELGEAENKTTETKNNVQNLQENDVLAEKNILSNLAQCPSKGTYHNCFGFYEYENGNTYHGEWQNDLPNGEGIYFYADTGDIYEGEVLDGKRNGYGEYYSSSGNEYYGDWKDNKKHGYGEFIILNGDDLVGEFKNDKFVGTKVIISKPTSVAEN